MQERQHIHRGSQSHAKGRIILELEDIGSHVCYALSQQVFKKFYLSATYFYFLHLPTLGHSRWHARGTVMANAQQKTTFRL